MLHFLSRICFHKIPGNGRSNNNGIWYNVYGPLILSIDFHQPKIGNLKTGKKLNTNNTTNKFGSSTTFYFKMYVTFSLFKCILLLKIKGSLNQTSICLIIFIFCLKVLLLKKSKKWAKYRSLILGM